MTTVPPAKVSQAGAMSLEKIAYKSVESIPTREPNDQYRLGFNVWRYLSEKKGTLAEAVRTAGARVLIPEADVIRIITEELKKAGQSVG